MSSRRCCKIAASAKPAAWRGRATVRGETGAVYSVVMFIVIALRPAVGALRMDVVDRRQGLVRGAPRGLADAFRAPRGLADAFRAARETVEDGQDPDDLVARLAERVERLERRAAGGDDVLHDE